MNTPEHGVWTRSTLFAMILAVIIHRTKMFIYHTILKGLDTRTPGRFKDIMYKEDNFCDFRFGFLCIKPPLKMDLL